MVRNFIKGQPKQLLIENAKYTNKDKLFWMTKDFMKFKGIRLLKGKCFAISILQQDCKNYMKSVSTVEWTKEYKRF